MIRGGRIGVFGGVFDPPHIGHRVVAGDLLERLHLDRLLVVPSARPPHRRAHLDARRRLRLARGAFAGEPRIEVSDLELRRSGPSYTVDTLEAIHKQRAPDELFCVMGADQFRQFHTWHGHERIRELATLVVMDRPGEAPGAGLEDAAAAGSMDPAPVDAGGVRPVLRVPVTQVDVSSTRVRERLAAGDSVRYLVPPEILALVERWYAPRDGTMASASSNDAGRPESREGNMHAC